jgi:Uma2 family endonuclease
MSEYLHTSYRPDRDYVDGIVAPREMGGSDHARIQSELLRYAGRHSAEWGVRACSEIRIQTSASHVRVANIALLPEAASADGAVDTPPVAVIEILAPGDRMPHYADRLDDYRRMGIHNIWVVDPHARKGFDASAEEWLETAGFSVPESPIRIELAAIFAAAEKDRAR